MPACRTADDPRLADAIRVIVIPDIRGKVPFDPFEPKVPADTLDQINQFLLGHCSHLARLTITNPTYVPIWIRLSVRFRQGYNVGYSTQVLDPGTEPVPGAMGLRSEARTSCLGGRSRPT